MLMPETPEALFITEQLDQRPCPGADYRRQSEILQELAVEMATDPNGVLPKFVDIAMELTGAISGGLSLFEEGVADTDAGVFRWHNLRGSLEPFDGATTPRNYSPCGVTLDRNGAVLIRHPEEGYTWVEEAGVVLPEVLLVPLYLNGVEALGTLWVVAGEEGLFTREHARILGEMAAFVGVALRMAKDKRALQTALAEQEILTQEMSHRVRNVFAVTDGMIRMSAKNATDKAEMVRSLSGRLHALSSAHSLVSRNLHSSQRALRNDIGALIKAVLAPHEDGVKSRFTMDGPVISCGDRAMTGLALIFHELATNSSKYGALSVAGGEVKIAWREEGPLLALSWTETGGPNVVAPSDSGGFGSTLIRNTVVDQFGGELAYHWRPEGLRVAMTLTMSHIAD